MSKSPTYVDKKARNTQVGDLQVEPHRVIDAREQYQIPMYMKAKSGCWTLLTENHPLPRKYLIYLFVQRIIPGNRKYC